MTKIDGRYICIKDRIRFKKVSIHNIFANYSYHCIEIIDGVIKVIVTGNSHSYLTFDEFQEHFYCVKESRRKKIEKIKKIVETD